MAQHHNNKTRHSVTHLILPSVSAAYITRLLQQIQWFPYFITVLNVSKEEGLKTYTQEEEIDIKDTRTDEVAGGPTFSHTHTHTHTFQSWRRRCQGQDWKSTSCASWTRLNKWLMAANPRTGRLKRCVSVLISVSHCCPVSVLVFIAYRGRDSDLFQVCHRY